MLRKKYQGYIRSDSFLKAVLVKHLGTILIIVVSVSWFVFWGLDLIFANNPLPWAKVVAVLFGYGTPITTIYFDYKRLKRRVELHRFYRECRRCPKAI